jgi:hypothetical protein
MRPKLGPQKKSDLSFQFASILPLLKVVESAFILLVAVCDMKMNEAQAVSVRCHGCDSEMLYQVGPERRYGSLGERVETADSMILEGRSRLHICHG